MHLVLIYTYGMIHFLRSKIRLLCSTRNHCYTALRSYSCTIMRMDPYLTTRILPILNLSLPTNHVQWVLVSDEHFIQQTEKYARLFSSNCDIKSMGCQICLLSTLPDRILYLQTADKIKYFLRPGSDYFDPLNHPLEERDKKCVRKKFIKLFFKPKKLSLLEILTWYYFVIVAVRYIYFFLWAAAAAWLCHSKILAKNLGKAKKMRRAGNVSQTPADKREEQGQAISQ